MNNGVLAWTLASSVLGYQITNMKLIIQIPCFNEAATLPIALEALPRELPGIDTIEWLVIDDGSCDGTFEIAEQNGVDHIIRHVHNLGLARAFMTGINGCLERGADIIVNFDADNQYNAKNIPDLIKPILDEEADLVIGARPINNVAHFSFIKKILQRLGSWVVRTVSQADVHDAPSGFRAISKKVAARTFVFSSYTYTLETIIQAGQQNFKIVNVPVEVNGELRPSRLFKSIPQYIFRSVVTMMRVFLIYRPARVVGSIAAIVSGLGLMLVLRFLYFFAIGEGNGHIQSLIIAAMLLIMGFQTFIAIFLADVISANRIMLEDIRFTQYQHREQTRSENALSKSEDKNEL